MEDAATLTQLLLDWDCTVDCGSSASSTNAELLDLFGELHGLEASPPGSNDTETDGQPAVSRSSLCRQRQREELKRLRVQAAELESLYDRLRRGIDTKRLRNSNADDETTLADVERPMHSVWERIARRQHELRRKAECENTKLRGLLDEHTRLAQRIEKAIHHRALEEQTTQAVEKKGAQTSAVLHTKAAERWKATATSPHWLRIFGMVFQNERFWMRELERELINITADASGRTMIESIYSTVFPFDLAKTSEAAWRCYSTRFMALTSGYFSVTHASDNLLAAESQVTMDVSGKPLVLRSDVLIHKVHEEADRVVVVWEDWSRSSTDADEAGTTDVASSGVVRVALDICVSMEQLARGSRPEAHVSPATLMRVYTVSRLSHNDSTSRQEDPIRLTGDKLVEAYHDSNRRFRQLVETYLLDDALGLATLHPNEGILPLLYTLKLGETVTTVPTVDFNVENFYYKNIAFTCWDVGGQSKLRPLWASYYQGCEAVVFVVDAADRGRVDVAARELHALFQNEELQEAKLLVLANKQDLLNCMRLDELHEKLDLPTVTKNASHIEPTVATTGQGVDEGLDWLAKAITGK